ncbi:MAG TPA: 50S ribosomal protein L2 [Patescibacteria group bacterium]|nr:50S ribosomal protein L2 [Patescibacteria group bacterium]
MPTQRVKPTTNARRKMSYLKFTGDKVKANKALTFGIKRTSGRNHAGQLVVNHRGGGAKRKYRLIDFSLVSHLGQKAEVLSIEYDPNRSANIALVQFAEDSKAYILAPDGLKKDDHIICDEKTPIRTGNRMMLKNIPASTQIHNVELTPGKGGQICRSAGSFATLLGVDGDYAQVRLMSSEVRKIPAISFASIGIVSNIDHSKVLVGKAGRKRHMGIKPTVLGKSKNPVDHPHGGGEGHTSIGLKYPKTPWGAPALGPRTRNKKKKSSNLILTRRKK